MTVLHHENNLVMDWTLPIWCVSDIGIFLSFMGLEFGDSRQYYALNVS